MNRILLHDKLQMKIPLLLSLFALLLTMVEGLPSLPWLVDNLQSYRQWKQAYSIEYASTSEDLFRLMVFIQNKREIDQHNRLESPYKLGVNQFTAMTHSEFVQKMSNLRIPSSTRRVEFEEASQVGVDIDWVKAGAVKPVRSEGQCGASYAYAALAAIESQLFIKKKLDVSLSWQQILDCSSSYGNYGCNGGYMTNCFDYARDKGLTTESAYPYTATTGKCKINSGDYKVTSYTVVPPGSCNALTNALSQGPVSIAIDSSQLQSYHSGIFTCRTPSSPSSGALMVGQNDQGWKVQMNFGKTWGVEGYIYLAPGNSCSVCDIASIPQI